MHEQGAPLEQDPVEPSARLVLSRRLRYILNVGSMRLSLVLLASVNACTRLLYETGDGNYIVGRSMDWFECLGSDLWSFPRGMKRDGGTGPKALTWTSKYGSVVVDAYDIAATDGMNEKGLVGNVLYLAEAEYGDGDPDKPQISIGAWLQYMSPMPRARPPTSPSSPQPEYLQDVPAGSQRLRGRHLHRGREPAGAHE